jgi:hypothetical protein
MALDARTIVLRCLDSLSRNVRRHRSHALAAGDMVGKNGIAMLIAIFVAERLASGRVGHCRRNSIFLGLSKRMRCSLML